MEDARADAVRDRAKADADAAALPGGKAEVELKRDWLRPPCALVLVALSGCAAPAPVLVDTYCERSRPIMVATGDHLTDGTARQILAHNKTWRGGCR